ncbi:MAG: rhodanese [Desulfobacterales bacterium]|nr:rhodanese [Deltaproteobacteria bacterium]NNK94560.1 rhodanese [Desulfobacterales bacterium]
MPAWKKDKKPLYSVSKSLKKMMDTETPVVLIDVRDAESAKATHIKGAISIPGDQLASYKDKFPKIKKAPVVLYGDDTGTGMKYFSLVRDWGYKNTTVLKGGFDGWQKASLPTGSGATATEIVYVPKPKPGVVSIEMFAKALDTTANDVVILDVRTDDETEAGKIAGAIAIPAEEVFERLDEIPKDKQVFVHCSTGVRAEMAYLTLKEKGYKANYLDANISVADGGKYTITEKE